jgi:DNA-directed RNA polymerase subunit RPC12/RpoP
VGEAAARNGHFEVVCPHCKKPFEAELLGGEADRHRGFKCPHCRLFVPFERAGEQDVTVPAD